MCSKFVNYCFLLFLGLLNTPEEQFLAACEYDDRIVVESMLQRKQLISGWDMMKLVNFRGVHAVHLVARAGWLEILKRFIDNEQRFLTVVDDELQWTPLFYAACNGHVPVVRFLLSQDKGQLAQRDSWHRTVLHTAADGGHLDVVTFLVEMGGDILAQDKQGYTPLHVAAGSGHAGVVAFLIDQASCVCRMHNSFSRTPLHEAAKSGAQEIVSLLCESGVCDLDAHDQAGRTPLHWAATNGALGCVQDLIQSGADVGSRDSLGRTPLHCAAEEDQYDVACELIQHGAQIDAQNRLGQTALMAFLEQPAPLLALSKLICARKLCRSHMLSSPPLLTLLVLVSDVQRCENHGKTIAQYFRRSDYAVLHDSLMRKRADYETQVFALTHSVCEEIPDDLRVLIHQFVFGP